VAASKFSHWPVTSARKDRGNERDRDAAEDADGKDKENYEHEISKPARCVFHGHGGALPFIIICTASLMTIGVTRPAWRIWAASFVNVAASSRAASWYATITATLLGTKEGLLLRLPEGGHGCDPGAWAIVEGLPHYFPK
jgi:hypothetical protein